MRDSVDEIFISLSLEETIFYLEKLAGSFEFKSEETTVPLGLYFQI